METPSIFRLRAVAAEHRARTAADATAKREWEDLAIQWHLLANVAAQASGQLPQVDMQ